MVALLLYGEGFKTGNNDIYAKVAANYSNGEMKLRDMIGKESLKSPNPF